MEDAAEDGREVVGEADDANGQVGQDAVEPQRQEQLEDGHAQATLEPVDLADDRVEPAPARGASEELQMVRVGYNYLTNTYLCMSLACFVNHPGVFRWRDFDI